MDKNLNDYNKDELINIVTNLSQEKAVSDTLVSEITQDYLEAKREVVKITQYASNLEQSLDSLGKQLANAMSNQEQEARDAQTSESFVVPSDTEAEA